jgi:hypothetical protein
MLFSVLCYSYNYSSQADLPDGVKKLLPENPDILASATADLNGDKTNDYAVIIQYKDPDDDTAAGAKLQDKEGRRLRELIIITSKEGQYSVAARTKRAVLCSGCGAADEDPFYGLKALTNSFTILHKFTKVQDDPWGIAAKFNYSKRDNKWQLVYFFGAGNTELKPDDFDLINLEDFDIVHYMSCKKVEAWPDKGAKPEIFGDDILYTEDGAAFVVRPDKSDIRYITGDRFFHRVGHPNWSRDRKSMAFIRGNDMYVIGSDGRGEKRLFRDVLKIYMYDYEREGSVTAMKWSPDGKKFAITGYKSSSDTRTEYLYLWGADGVTKSVKECDEKNRISSICWSPDSSKLAYYRGATLTVMDVDSGSEKVLFAGSGRSGIAWSEDGNRILTVVEGGYGIVDAGSGSIRVVKCLAWSGYGPLFWSKDEKNALYYSSDYVFMSPVEEGGKPHTVIGRTDGLIDGLSW